MFFKDPTYNFQALRTLSATPIQCADINECLQTIQLIEEGKDESWFTQWNLLAQRLEKEAENFKNENHHISASSAYKRASNYYRTAEFFLHIHPNDSRMLQTWRKSRDCFLLAIENQSPTVMPIQIPFEGTFLPGYLCLVDNSHLMRPLIIAQTGFDGTAEEICSLIGAAAVSRGYNCLVFEGPGQGQVIREQKIPFRWNWETVITPVVDYALDLPYVSKDHMTLLGLSFGGYLVPRALAFEKRINYGIVNGGIYDYHAVCMKALPLESETALDHLYSAQELDQIILEEAKHNSSIRWGINQGMYTFNAKTPTEWFKMTRKYQLKEVIANISCHMLVVDSEQDFQMRDQSKQFFDHLQCQKDWLIFTKQEGAGAHCQIGAYSLSNERIFNWLDKQMLNAGVHIYKKTNSK